MCRRQPWECSSLYPQMSHRMNLIKLTSIVWILLCIQASALPWKQVSLGLPSAIEAVWESSQPMTQGGIPQLVVQGPVISKAVHLHHNDQLAYHLWISAVTMLQCMASLSTWFQLNTRGSYSVAYQSLYLWTVRLLKTDDVRTSTLFLALTPTNTCLTYQFDHLLP